MCTTAQQGYNATYGYDEIGNLTGKTEAGATWSYGYGGVNAQPHAVLTYTSSITTNTYAYDANGSMTTRNLSGTVYGLVYDVEGRLTGVTDTVTATFTYDGDGSRVKSTIGGVTTLHVGDHYEKVGNVIRKYYFFNGRRVAMREDGTLYWLLSDQLGSTSMAVDSSGAVHSGERYWPWGGARVLTNTLPTDFRFTDQQAVEAIGLLDYNARWYDSQLGRFCQADSIVPQAGNPQALNRYAYCYNSPLRYTDPTGKFTEEELLGWGISPELIAQWRKDAAWWAMIRAGHLLDVLSARAKYGMATGIGEVGGLFSLADSGTGMQLVLGALTGLNSENGWMNLDNFRQGTFDRSVWRNNRLVGHVQETMGNNYAVAFHSELWDWAAVRRDLVCLGLDLVPLAGIDELTTIAGDLGLAASATDVMVDGLASGKPDIRNAHLWIVSVPGMVTSLADRLPVVGFMGDLFDLTVDASPAFIVRSAVPDPHGGDGY